MDQWRTYLISSESIDFDISEHGDVYNDTECLIEALPVEILEHIMEYLDLVHVYRMAQTKKIFNILRESKWIWMSLFKQRFNSVRDKNFLETNEDPIDYKDVLLTYEQCLREVSIFIDGISQPSPAFYLSHIETLIQKYPGVAVRILIDLEVHHFLFSTISDDLETFFKYAELLVSENYGLMKCLHLYALAHLVDNPMQNRVINVMMDLPLRNLNDHHGDQCCICLVTPIKGSLLYASESSDFKNKFCGKCYFKAPKEEYLVLRSNNFMKKPNATICQATNNPLTRIHYTSCSNCEAYPIYGAVYRCVICSNALRNFIDLCLHCQALHPDNHTFLELRKRRDNYFSVKRSELLDLAQIISEDVDYNFNDENVKDWMIPPIEFEYDWKKVDWIGFVVDNSGSRLVKMTAKLDARAHQLDLIFPNVTRRECFPDKSSR